MYNVQNPSQRHFTDIFMEENTKKDTFDEIEEKVTNAKSISRYKFVNFVYKIQNFSIFFSKFQVLQELQRKMCP